MWNTFSSWADNVKATAQSVGDSALLLKDTLTLALKEQQEQIEIEERKSKQLYRKRLLANNRFQQQQVYEPWYTGNTESKSILQGELQHRILQITENKEKYLEKWKQFNEPKYNYDSLTIWALKALDVHPGLSKFRHEIVPAEITDQNFWSLYFHWVNDIRRSLGIEELNINASLDDNDNDDNENEEHYHHHNNNTDKNNNVESNNFDSNNNSIIQNNDKNSVMIDNEFHDDDDLEEFMSEDFVSSGLQDEKLVNQMKAELGIIDNKPSPIINKYNNNNYDDIKNDATITNSTNHDEDIDIDNLDDILATVRDVHTSNENKISDDEFDKELNESFRELGIDV